MCRICESSGTVKQAAEALTAAIAERLGNSTVRNPVGRAMAAAARLDPATPIAMRALLDQIDRTDAQRRAR